MDLRESVQCPECGTWGWTGSKCPSAICGYVHGKSLGQNMQKAMGETADDIGAAASRMAAGTKEAAGEVADVVGGEMAAQGKMAAAGVAVGVGAAFAVGGFWMALSVLVGAYVGILATPSILGFFIHSRLFMILMCAVCGLLVGLMGGIWITFKIGLALRQRDKSCFWLFVPLAVVATLLTMRASDAASAWWETASWW